jgi:hypothetical protein
MSNEIQLKLIFDYLQRKIFEIALLSEYSGIDGGDFSVFGLLSCDNV